MRDRLIGRGGTAFEERLWRWRVGGGAATVGSTGSPAGGRLPGAAWWNGQAGVRWTWRGWLGCGGRAVPEAHAADAPPFRRAAVLNEWKWFTADLLVALIYVGIVGYVLDRIVVLAGRLVTRGTSA